MNSQDYGGNEDDQNTTFQSNHNQLSTSTQQKRKQPLISFKYHPGFFCFFEEYVNKKGWTFHECYEKVFLSHHQLSQIRKPTAQLINDPKLDKTRKILELMHRAEKDKVYAYYLKGQNEDKRLQCNITTHQDRKIEQITKLQKQLDKLEKIKQRVVDQKKKEFQKKIIEKSKQLEKQLEALQTQKQRRATLVKKVQLEAQEQNKFFKQQRQKKWSKRMDFLNNTGISQCQIM